MTDSVRVGFIGLGLMGTPMATQVLRSGFALTVYDVDATAVAKLVAEGAQAAATPRELAERSDLVVCMLPHPDVLRTVLLGPDGVVAAAPAPTAVVDMSTSGPGVVTECAKELSARGVAMADAPVGKGPWAAEKGELTILYGGDDATFAVAEPVLAAMGSAIHRCGPLGSGQVIKLANNLVSCANMSVLAEAYALTKAYGADTDVLVEVMPQTSADSWQLRNTLIAKILQGDLSPMFKLGLAHKDMRLILELAESLGTTIDAGRGAYRWYDTALREGHGDHDWGAVALVNPDAKR